MLRMLFGEEPRQAEGSLAETFRQMDHFIAIVQGRISRAGDSSHKLRTYEIWTKGLKSALDGLEQSQYAAHGFAARVNSIYANQMSNEEQLDYHRHVYFYKNTFIRLFSVLDKLGTLMNAMLNLETERLKSHFSYYTVLRGMRQRKLHSALSDKLEAIKEKSKESMDLLRKRRNTEIHYMNTEMQDDLIQSHQAYGKEPELENMKAQLVELDKGCAMVIESLRLVFEYSCRWMSKPH